MQMLRFPLRQVFGDTAPIAPGRIRSSPPSGSRSSRERFDLAARYWTIDADVTPDQIRRRP